MSDNTILSQREIDSLLSEVESAAAPTTPEGRAGMPTSLRGLGKTVKRYDFRRPDKFSKEHLRTLQALHETFARLAASTLSNRLRCNAEIKVSSIDQGLYEEYVGQISAQSFLNVVQMAPLDGSVILEYGQDIGLIMVDRLLGGAGALLDRGHDVTDIEVQLLRNIGASLAAALGEAWGNLAETQPALSEIHQDIQMVQVAPSTEVVIMVFMELTLLDVVGGFSICTPFSVLEGVMARLNAQTWVGTGGRKIATASARRDLRLQIARTPVPLSAELGSVQVPARDIARLEVGDVIRLESGSHRAIPVRVSGVRKWIGHPGVVDGHVAIRIERWDPEELPSARGRTSDEPVGSPPEPIPLPVQTSFAAEGEASRAA